jgi:hypothetical protein
VDAVADTFVFALPIFTSCHHQLLLSLAQPFLTEECDRIVHLAVPRLETSVVVAND